METTENTAVHPTRKINICNTCSFILGPGPYQLVCNHPSMPVDIVTGDAIVYCQDASGNRKKLAEINLPLGFKPEGFNLCGEEGKLFQARTAAAAHSAGKE